MWKKTDKLRHENIKFKNVDEMKEFADDIQRLNELEILDYKIVNEKGFIMSFTNKFTDYYNSNFDIIKLKSIGNMTAALKQFPEDISKDKKIREEQLASMFYSTLFVSYIQDMKLEKKINLEDRDSVARLIITMEQVKDMIIHDINEEDIKR